jgi:hypothetical protein
LKQLLSISFVLFLTAQASAATLIECSNQKGLLRIKRLLEQGQGRWLLEQLDESISSDYIGGRMDESGEVMVRQRNAHSDFLEAGDGNYWIRLTMPKASLKSLPGAAFKAELEVIYDDIAEDFVKNDLSCKVLK